METYPGFFGPAYLVSVGYMDPGNWATDLAGGSQFGYSLLWVLVMSNLMALLLQSLSARLGIVRNRDLAQANRETYPKKVNFALYILAEIAIAATDLAEILGMAIGLQLLTGMPLIYGVMITALDTFLLIMLQRLGMRKLEAFIIGLIFIIAMSFLIQIMVAKPDASEVISGLVPHIENDTALYIAIGIIGATVMPHNLYLHSALVQTRKFNRDDASIKKALKLNFIDSAVALNMALLVNAAILILAAAVFYKTGRSDVGEIKQAYELLPQHLGSNVAAKLFAIALIAAGQSSTITGTLAGQIVMEGYLRLRINPIVRRLITRLIAIVPAALVILINGEEDVDSLLIFSQVVLSMQLGFAIIPLIHFVSDKKTMGKFVIKPWVKVSAWLITVVLVYLNARLIVEEAMGFFYAPGNLIWKIFIILGAIGFVALLGYTTFFPFLKKRSEQKITIHDKPKILEISPVRKYNRIAITLDFGDLDQKVISHALSQGTPESVYYLIHITESVAGGANYTESMDDETVNDYKFLEEYVSQLKAKGHQAEAKLGFGNTVDSIAKIINDSNAELLVIGAHGHRGIKDLIYGETINQVRHLIHIPVLIVPAKAGL
ncbi:Nramp family divalent metal transporter [Niabella hibiscisoli]|uniref:Nramp family divalent metal transporter n=1 Tax=Niabella hibiscisoli TaxID=1825928 RepID=UPI001F1036B6|nr:Nramp family divalent metal transporter [Niabella hibiscisoli]MCH5719127.1 Nramp family divalent metal transporter [Niabella hibiscisoli]